MSTPKNPSSKSHEAAKSTHAGEGGAAATKTHHGAKATHASEPEVATANVATAKGAGAAETAATATATPAAASGATPDTSTSKPVVVMQLPPADASIPKPPSGFVPTNGADYRGIVPKKAELAVLPQAIAELGRFTDWAVVFGRTAPQLDVFHQTLNAALQWSLMRNETDAWDLFARTMEGLCWTEARGMMDKFQPTFAAVVAADATIKTQNPSLASLLNAATVIAQRGAATRKANARAKANGDEPVKGKAAQRVKRAQKIVADAQARAQGASASSTPPSASDAATTGASAPPAPAAATNGAPSTNGAAH